MEDVLTRKIINACYQVHNALGPGLAERVYANALRIVFKNSGLAFQEEQEFCIYFNGVLVGKFRADLVVEDMVIVEIKAVGGMMPKLFEAQVASYLRASSKKVGLLINFGASRCHIRRLVV